MRLRDRRPGPRRTPRQARSKVTVDALLEAAARVFKREGFAATTNRIAREAGVGIGSLYEYFPDKHALLLALAERHVELAEREIRAVIARDDSTRALLAGLQRAIVTSQRFPSQALELVAQKSARGALLRARAGALRAEVLQALAARARHLPEPGERALAVFGVICEMTARSMYTLSPSAHAAHTRHLLAMAAAYLA